MNRQVKRFLLAGCVSFVIVLVITLSMVLRYGKYTDYDRYVAYLFAPAVMVANKLHLLGDPVLEFWAVAVGSLVFYTVVVWLVFSLWVRMRTGE